MSAASRRIALICPSSIGFMPYVENYESILRRLSIDYDLILWDRFGSAKDEGRYVYRDSKVGHKRSFIDYCLYSRFVSKHVSLTRYSGVVVFGLQLAFFLQKLLARLQGRYLVDVRDHNRILSFYGVKGALKDASFVVISSPGYAEWAQGAGRLIVNHNTNLSDATALPDVLGFPEGRSLNVACIGALRDLDINIALIDSLAHSSVVSLAFHGQGDINDSIRNYILQKKVRNVVLTGRYARSEEAALYANASFVNVLRYSDGINNKTALPNRLYNSAISGRPMLAFEGTHLADIVAAETLGLVIDSFDGVEERLIAYAGDFDCAAFDRSRGAFMKAVIAENQGFRSSVEQFFQQ